MRIDVNDGAVYVLADERRASVVRALADYDPGDGIVRRPTATTLDDWTVTRDGLSTSRS